MVKQKRGLKLKQHLCHHLRIAATTVMDQPCSSLPSLANDEWMFLWVLWAFTHPFPLRLGMRWLFVLLHRERDKNMANLLTPGYSNLLSVQRIKILKSDIGNPVSQQQIWVLHLHLPVSSLTWSAKKKNNCIYGPLAEKARFLANIQGYSACSSSSQSIIELLTV